MALSLWRSVWRIAMAQRLRNNIFVNLPPLPLLCEISGALHLRNRVLQ